ncbi:hypothetical protein [Geochorda subterranea]|uniref:Uncharacterized protein n=1 Tax=Geochorda subterranea TaxID=3109564 RepID=A0ABZ1BK83_9FIRM|nr:hypothetical protein [Limnochorda sp. LNt]WRP13234.1 hypothetical protein VLY81_07140 [Limnochorda sp. LNt]
MFRDGRMVGTLDPGEPHRALSLRTGGAAFADTAVPCRARWRVRVAIRRTGMVQR